MGKPNVACRALRQTLVFVTSLVPTSACDRGQFGGLYERKWRGKKVAGYPAEATPGQYPGRGLVFCPSIFTGQVDDVVGEVELCGVERKIGVRDLFAKDHVSIAVVTGERGGFVGLDVERPNLELFGGDVLVVRLD